MICCIFIASVIAVPLFFRQKLMGLLGYHVPNPMAWRLNDHNDMHKTTITPVNSSQPFSWSARAKSFYYAMQGLAFVTKHEHNFRIHLMVTAFTLLTCFALRINSNDWIVILLLIFWVLFAEAINTAIEHVCNIFSPEPNEQVRIAKDVAAGAVLLSAIAATLIGAIRLWPYIAALI